MKSQQPSHITYNTERTRGKVVPLRARLVNVVCLFNTFCVLLLMSDRRLRFCLSNLLTCRARIPLLPPRYSPSRSRSMSADVPPLKRQKTEENHIPLIGTHNGTFHCDEALAVFLLRQTPTYNRSSGSSHSSIQYQSFILQAVMSRSTSIA